jgi:DNA-binding CsgD family transcriptional regulator
LSDEDAAQPIRLALDIADGALADRLAAVLAGVAGLRLVAAGDAADAIILAATRAVQRGNEELALGLEDDGVRIAPVDVSLTPRELEVLALLAEGASNKTIARRLVISVHTAKFHVASVIDKLDAIGRTDAVAHAARLGIIDL